MRKKKIIAIDAETDPFLYGRTPEPFIWGAYWNDGRDYHTFDSTKGLVTFLAPLEMICYAHNGGKFDFMFLLKYLGETKAQIINGRFVSMYIGACELRDSYAIIPEPLKKFGAKRDIAIEKLESTVRAQHMEEIRDYLFWDCKILYEGVQRYREIAGTKTTIASNALSHARKLGIDPGKTSHSFDRKYRSYYYGGRCECFQGGTHHNLTLLDIHSAYPAAMMQDHATSDEFVNQSDFRGLNEEQIARSFVKLECTSDGAFPIRTKTGLIFPHEYNVFSVTGWEYLAAKKLGLFRDEKLINVSWTAKTINFQPYVKHWYEYKAAHDKETDPVNYTIGKIMMNSLYGKLAQNPARYYDYRIVAAGTELDHKNGWLLSKEFDGHEIHRRESLWKYKHELGVQWEGKAIYKNVATGASITGHVRATLLLAMHTLGMEHVLYCDTDGLVVTQHADINRLQLSPRLGDWGIDDTGASIGHFAGKKLYGIKLSTGKEKIASKGSRLNFSHIERIVNGETVRWQNDAPSFKIDGSASFVVRDIRATVTLPKATAKLEA